MSDAERKEIREKIFTGLSLAYKRLVEQKQKNDENLVVYRGGEVVVLKARDI